MVFSVISYLPEYKFILKQSSANVNMFHWTVITDYAIIGRHGIRPLSVSINLFWILRINVMEKIASFTVNHEKLMPGVYVSRKDTVGGQVITTFDLRMTKPNREPVMNTAEVHTIEHLGATFLRNHAEWKSRVIYFGPMGCRTGFYLLLSGELSPFDISPLLVEMFTFIAGYTGEIPGADALSCGNYLDQNLPMARYLARKYLAEALSVLDESNTSYPV